MLVDTGANISIVSKACIDDKQFDPPRYKLSGIGGGTVKSVGCTSLIFYINGVQFQEEVEVVTTITDGYDAIPGMDFLTKHHAKIDLSQQTVELTEQCFS